MKKISTFFTLFFINSSFFKDVLFPKFKQYYDSRLTPELEEYHPSLFDRILSFINHSPSAMRNFMQNYTKTSTFPESTSEKEREQFEYFEKPYFDILPKAEGEKIWQVISVYSSCMSGFVSDLEKHFTKGEGGVHLSPQGEYKTPCWELIQGGRSNLVMFFPRWHERIKDEEMSVLRRAVIE